MFTYSKFLLILFFFIIAPIYAMKRNNESISKETQKANAELLQIIKAAKNNDTFHFQEEDWEKIKKCLENGADPNLKIGPKKMPLISLVIQNQKKDLFDYLLQLGTNINARNSAGDTPLFILMNSSSPDKSTIQIEDLLKNRANTYIENGCGLTPLGWAAQKGFSNAIKSLIKYRAQVDSCDVYTPLARAIMHDNLEAIKELCEAGASAIYTGNINIDNYNDTVFHLAAKKTEKIIKTLMTHINFKNNNNNKTNKIKTILLVFNSNEFKFKIPHEIQIIILSKLLSPTFFHKGLYKTLVNKGYDHLPLKLVNEHIQLLNQILQIKNNKNKIALELAPKSHLYTRKTKTELLLDGTELQKDLDILNAKYHDLSSIPKNNLALQILENHYNPQNQRQSNV